MKYLITGPTGTIGMSLIKQLSLDDNDIWVICNPKSRRSHILKQFKNIKVIYCDMNSYDSIKEEDLPESWDCTINLAWKGTIGGSRDDMLIQSYNILSGIQIIELSHKHNCKLFVGAGSQAEYGRKNHPIREDENTNPENGYGIAKLALNKMSKILCEKYRMRFLWLRIFSVYGPYENYYSLTISTILKCINNKKPSFTSAEQLWDYAYTDDVADSIIKLIYGQSEGVYNIGSGKMKPLSYYIDKIIKASNYKGDIGYGEIAYSTKQVMYLCADISKLKETIGDCMKTSFDEGIKNTIDWCRSLNDYEV